MPLASRKKKKKIKKNMKEMSFHANIKQKSINKQTNNKTKQATNHKNKSYLRSSFKHSELPFKNPL